MTRQYYVLWGESSVLFQLGHFSPEGNREMCLSKVAACFLEEHQLCEFCEINDSGNEWSWLKCLSQLWARSWVSERSAFVVVIVVFCFTWNYFKMLE